MVQLAFVAVRPLAVKAPMHQRIRRPRSATALVTMDVQAPRSKAVPRIPGPSAIPTAIVSVDSASSTKSFIGRQTGYKLFQPLSQTWVSISDIRYQDNGVHSMYDIYTTTPGNYVANGYLDPLKDGPH